MDLRHTRASARLSLGAGASVLLALGVVGVPASASAAARMPAYWAAIPQGVVTALEQSPNGQVPYGDYMRLFPHR